MTGQRRNARSISRSTGSSCADGRMRWKSRIENSAIDVMQTQPRPVVQGRRRMEDWCIQCAVRRATTLLAQCMASGRLVCLNTRRGSGYVSKEQAGEMLSKVQCRCKDGSDGRSWVSSGFPLIRGTVARMMGSAEAGLRNRQAGEDGITMH